MSEQRDYQEINIEQLVPFAKHPFNLYTGKRKADLIESVRNNGIIVPIVVRPTEDGKFEILSGHNRAEAAKEVGLPGVPAIVREDLSDDEDAMLVVTETNLIQRSFNDLKHSERAVAITAHHNATKHQGRRTDLLHEIDELLGTSRPMGEKSITSEQAHEKYEISARTISRYLRIDKLIPELKERLDNEEFAIRVGEALSFLRKNEQAYVNKILAMGKDITIKQADALHEESRKGDLSKDFIKEVLSPGFFGAKVKPIKISGKLLSRYFDVNKSAKDIEDVMAKALEAWFAESRDE